MNDEELKQYEAKTARVKANAFAQWMARPETKLMFSLIPAANTQDVLVVLAQSAFNTGFDTGTGEILIRLTTEVFKDRK